MTPGGHAWPELIVVTPSYNQGAFLEATIRSVLLQGYPNLAYFVVDGGSTDGSVEIIQKYEPWLARWVSEKDEGQYAAINKGFANQKAEIMGWINSDDMYCPGALQVAGEVFADLDDVKWLTSGVQVTWDVDGRWIGTGHAAGYTRRGFFSGRNLGRTGRAARLQPVIQQESTFWRRALWDAAGGTLNADLHLAGDFELWARFWAHAGLSTVNVPLGGFRRQPEQKTANPEKYQKEACEILSRLGGKVRSDLAYVCRASLGCWQKSPADLRRRVRFDLDQRRWTLVKRFSV
ncbi:MAG: glycosyltransferase family 2 protein [Verrucomicrobia bacterium]|nr:glycosyltransferase family 2 protein [Verrucomicrobiota bacterium]